RSSNGPHGPSSKLLSPSGGHPRPPREPVGIGGGSAVEVACSPSTCTTGLIQRAHAFTLKAMREKPPDRKSLAAQRRAAAQALAPARWAGNTPEERSAELKWAGSHARGGRPRSTVPRCPCGTMTLKLAQQRADKQGTGLGHQPGCTFYRAKPHLE